MIYYDHVDECFYIFFMDHPTKLVSRVPHGTTKTEAPLDLGLDLTWRALNQKRAKQNSVAWKIVEMAFAPIYPTYSKTPCQKQQWFQVDALMQVDFVGDFLRKRPLHWDVKTYKTPNSLNVVVGSSGISF